MNNTITSEKWEYQEKINWILHIDLLFRHLKKYLHSGFMGWHSDLRVVYFSIEHIFIHSVLLLSTAHTLSLHKLPQVGCSLVSLTPSCLLLGWGLFLILFHMQHGYTKKAEKKNREDKKGIGKKTWDFPPWRSNNFYLTEKGMIYNVIQKICYPILKNNLFWDFSKLLFYAFQIRKLQQNKSESLAKSLAPSTGGAYYSNSSQTATSNFLEHLNTLFFKVNKYILIYN